MTWYSSSTILKSLVVLFTSQGKQKIVKLIYYCILGGFFVSKYYRIILIHFMNQWKVCLIQFHENFWQSNPPHFIAPFYLFYVERKTQDLEKAFLDSDLLRLMKMAEKSQKKETQPISFLILIQPKNCIT